MAAIILACSAGVAWAHDPFEITTHAQLRADGLELRVTIAPSTAMRFLSSGAELPAIDPDKFEQLRPRFVARARALYTVTAGGAVLPPRRIQVELGRENDVEFHLVYPLPAKGALRFDAAHVSDLPDNYCTLLTVHAQDGALLGQKLLSASDPSFEAVPAPPSAAVSQPAPTPGFLPFLKLGFEHILTGYDHLLFLCGLLVVCRGFRPMVGIITCFTLAHSLTLALAALGVFALPAHIVEPLIAASIAFVGIENLLRGEEPKGRWALTFAFGLVHGFGFAGALQEAGTGLSGVALSVPLFSFNLGVELGQLGVVMVAFPLLLWLRARPGFVRLGQPALSAIIVIAGTCWLLQRTVLT